MGNYLRWLLSALFIGLFFVFLQQGVFGMLLPAAAVPNLFVGFVLYLAFFHPSGQGAFLSFLLGLLFDVSSGGLLGPWASVFVLSYGVLALISDRIFIEARFALGLIALFVTLAFHGLYWLITFDVTYSNPNRLIEVAGQAVASAVAAPFVISAVQAWRRRFISDRSSYSRVR